MTEHINDAAPDGILAIIPAYNEGSHISAVVRGARAYLPVLVVDDGSDDETSMAAEEAGAEVLRLSPNQGKGAALQAGIQRALRGDYAAVITLDADGQHDPDEIPKFIDAFHEKQADLIIGARNFSEMPPVRRLANSVGRLSFSWALGRPIPDNQSGFRLLTARMMALVLDSTEAGYEFEIEMIVRCVQAGYELSWIPIRTIYTGGGSHIQPWHHAYHFFRVVWETRRRMREWQRIP